MRNCMLPTTYSTHGERRCFGCCFSKCLLKLVPLQIEEESERTFDPANCERTNERNIAKTIPSTVRTSGKVNLRQTFERFSFFSPTFFSLLLLLPLLSPFSAIRHSINVTATDMPKQQQKTKYVCICLYFFVPSPGPGGFFVEIPTGELCLHFCVWLFF